VNHFSLYPETRWGLNFLALLGVLAALWLGRMLFVPVVIALMLTAMLWPSFKYLHKNWRLPRGWASFILTLGLVLLAILATVWTLYAVQEIVGEFNSQDKLQNHYQTLRRQVRLVAPDDPTPLRHHHQILATSSLITSLGGWLSAPDAAFDPTFTLLGIQPDKYPAMIIGDVSFAEKMFPEDPKQSVIYSSVLPFLSSLVESLPRHGMFIMGQIILILFLVLFMLMEGDLLMRRTVELFGPPEGPDSQAAMNALGDMASAVRSYLVWRTIINILMAILLGLIYKQLGLRHPWLWAILAGILTYVPYIGPIIAALPTLADAFLEQGMNGLVVVGVIYIIVLSVEGYLVFPLVLGRNMEMNATTVMLACTFWWLVWGEIGLFLALPLMAGIKAICQHVPGWRPWANLMAREAGEEKPTPPTAETKDGQLAPAALAKIEADGPKEKND
jgi:AI-2 transport protein TqsA